MFNLAKLKFDDIFENRLPEEEVREYLIELYERGDLIAVYRVMNSLEKLDRDDLVIGEERSLRGNGRRLRKATCSRDIKKKSFPQRCVEAWNGLGSEVVQAKTISAFKAKLDESGLKDGTARA